MAYSNTYTYLGLTFRYSVNVSATTTKFGSVEKTLYCSVDVKNTTKEKVSLPASSVKLAIRLNANSSTYTTIITTPSSSKTIAVSSSYTTLSSTSGRKWTAKRSPTESTTKGIVCKLTLNATDHEATIIDNINIPQAMVSVKRNNEWYPITSVHINVDDVWKTLESIEVKGNDTWHTLT